MQRPVKVRVLGILRGSAFLQNRTGGLLTWRHPWSDGGETLKCRRIFTLDIPQRDVLKCAANESVYSFPAKKNKWIYYKWPRKNESVNENLR